MSVQIEVATIVRQTIREFCLSFLDSPYLCYTEHGLHALLYTMLYNALPPEQRYTVWGDKKVCVVQNEYPTAGQLGKSRRQNWDIAVIKTPPQSLAGKQPSYDYLRLAAVVELGMNEAEAHLQDDIERVSHGEANTDERYIVHLCRLSGLQARFSGRDWSSHSARICSREQIAKLVVGRSVEVYYGVWDGSGKYETGMWCISGQGIARV